jgi:hypothetical protein
VASFSRAAFSTSAFSEAAFDFDPAAVVVTSPGGGRRIKPKRKEDDDGKTYVPLDDRTIASLWPPSPALAPPIVTQRQTVAEPDDALSPALLMAIVATLDSIEDD